MTPVKVLIIDPDRDVLETVKAHTTRSGFEALGAQNGKEGIEVFLANTPQAIILRDVMPGLSGWDTAQRIREMSDIPILFISDHRDRASMERALSLGDDYMPPPWNWERLLAKLSALLKRYSAEHKNTLLYDDGYLKVDLASRLVSKGGESIYLTDTEFKLLSFFIRRANQVLKYDELLEYILGHTYAKAKSHVSRYVGYLRKKIEDDSAHPVYFCTERGVGYSFKSRAFTNQDSK
ncbi:MAG: response regulator transcription factor [Chloroflexi bacterium]|nr:response regulator transcription factor [Chloroflexota bacterium]